MTEAIPLDRDRIILRAANAKQFLGQEMVRTLFAEIRADAATAWQNTAANEREAREEYYTILLGLKALEAKLETWVQDGVKAQADIDFENRARGVNAINGRTPNDDI